MQKTLDAMAGGNQSATIENRKILYSFCTIVAVIGVSYKLNRNLALISLHFRELFKRLGFHAFLKLVLSWPS